MDEQARPQATAAPPTSVKRLASPVSDTPLKKPKTHTALPDEVMLNIADHLSFADLAAFSQVNKRTYHLMEERRWAARCGEQTSKVSNLASWQQLIDDIERIQAEPGLRAEPFITLSNRLPCLPYEQQSEAFERLFAAADRLPEQSLQIQKKMLTGPTMRRIHPRQRARIFDFAYAMAERRRPDQDNFWPELAHALWSIKLDLSIASRQSSEYQGYVARYQALLNQLAHLDSFQKAELVSRLTNQLNARIFFRGGGSVSSAYAILQQQTLSLPASVQGAPVGTLAAAVETLPEAERAARYAEMRHLALSLPDEQLGIALPGFAAGLSSVPLERRTPEFQRLAFALPRVPPTQRVQVATDLLKHTPELDDALSKQVWRHALQLLDGSSDTALSEVLSKSHILLYGTKLQWEYVIDELQAFMDRNRYTEQARATQLESIHSILSITSRWRGVCGQNIRLHQRFRR
ncbi:F-box protein [Burkholderia sp. b13]|nr:F-box protein [Burkholderia sp. b13]